MNCDNAWKAENRCTGMGNVYSMKFLSRFPLNESENLKQIFINLHPKWLSFQPSQVLIFLYCVWIYQCLLWRQIRQVVHVFYLLFTLTCNIETILVIKVLLSFLQHLHQRLIYSNIEDDVEDVRSFPVQLVIFLILNIELLLKKIIGKF